MPSNWGMMGVAKNFKVYNNRYVSEVAVDSFVTLHGQWI